MADTTQDDIDALAHEIEMIAPSDKLAEVKADIKAKAYLPLGAQARYIRRMIDMFESADLAKYQPEPLRVQNDGRKRPAKSNPFGKEGWNVSAQGKMFQTLGEAKTREIAAAAGVKISDTTWNKDYV